ncbi:hypothetical protein SPACI_023180 [Sporomusa acidovorans DSM 3132]|uniref:Uncharacterized protein n=1 Tax=Sporomusa acidovorans (strain ATCC 49682 / DSM 3132 / Mol) TaxID=1123286 RepID=A0ABZ3J1Q2_SPOA4|nr:hypothetical protein SPACI_08460 [Sporomusa acidovorans DSM 3132]SDE97346.1 hypothetical protein SAMN04488499_102830 [Sporomusa acidovorans]
MLFITFYLVTLLAVILWYWHKDKLEDNSILLDRKNGTSPGAPRTNRRVYPIQIYTLVRCAPIYSYLRHYESK